MTMRMSNPSKQSRAKQSNNNIELDNHAHITHTFNTSHANLLFKNRTHLILVVINNDSILYVYKVDK